MNLSTMRVNAMFAQYLQKWACAIDMHINKDHRQEPVKSKQVCYHCTGGGITAKRTHASLIIWLPKPILTMGLEPKNLKF